MRAFVETDLCRLRLRCNRCRDPRARCWRDDLGRVFALPPGGVDFPCPFGLPWVEPAPAPGVTAPCVPDAGVAAATWCERFGLPTGPHACEVCTAARQHDPADPDLAPWFAQKMRDLGRLYGATACMFRRDTGRTVERRCCGGHVKQVPVWDCAFIGGEAHCQRCRDRWIPV
jgi:hypothetical protein